MQHLLNNFKILILLLLPVLFSCSKSEKNIIPEQELVQIVSEMYLADQYLENHETIRAMSDTLLVYDGIFAKYGYTFEDYKRTINVYLQDGNMMYKVYLKAQNILKKEKDRVRSILDYERGLIIDWWALDSLKKRVNSDLWKEPFLRSVKWLSREDEAAGWQFTDTTIQDIPQNPIWWENNIFLNIPGNKDTLYTILTMDYENALQRSKAEELKRLKKEEQKKRNREKEKNLNKKKNPNKKNDRINLKKENNNSLEKR